MICAIYPSDPSDLLIIHSHLLDLGHVKPGASDLHTRQHPTPSFPPSGMPLKASKLCKSLSEILRDTHSQLSMLDYFIQYTESVGALHMVQFWLSVESFRATAHKPLSPTKPNENSRRPNTLDKSGRSSFEATSPLSEIVYGVKGSLVESRINSSTEKSQEARTWPSSSPHSSNGSVGSPGSPGNSGRDKHRVLQRRDTENHKYCNCRIHDMHQQESPSSSLIHGLGCAMADGDGTELHNNVPHDSLAMSKRSHDSPAMSKRSHDSPAMSKRSHDSPVMSKRSHDSPAMANRSCNSPATAKRSNDSSSPALVNRSNQSSPALVKRSNEPSLNLPVESQHHTHNHVQSQQHATKLS